MRASQILNKLLRRCIAKIHPLRAATLLAAIDALVRTGRASLTALGRGLSATTIAKYRIKRIDRLLGNTHLHGELLTWYGAIAARLLRGSSRPTILIDWTELTSRWWSLTAAVPVDGRAIPIYSEVHPPSGNGNARQIHRFLSVLRRLIPAEIHPTLVADAGFTKPFFDACFDCRFDYVVRLRGKGRLDTWDPHHIRTTVEAVALEAGRRARCLGDWRVYDSNRRGAYLRIAVAKRTGLLRREGDDCYRKRSVEPWVLATTCRDLSPDQVVGLYALRMRIEEMFRDAKNPRFGWSLAHTSTRSSERLEVLLLITTLAMLAVSLVGAAADEARCTRFLQANTTRNRAVLSLFRVGCLVLAEWDDLAKLARFRR